MKIFDSHCHLDDRSYDQDLEQVIADANAADVCAMMVVGIHLSSSRKAAAIAANHQGCYAAVGAHPHDVKHLNRASLDSLIALSTQPKVKAWGEIGLDFNRMFSPRETQEQWFITQLETACSLGLPMIFHERDSLGRFRQILRDHFKPGQQGVVHCFSGTAAELKAYLDMGLYIGITGVLTLRSKGESLRELATQIPTERLVIETDAPYLTPTPDRNKHRRNEPAFVRSVLYKLAQVKKSDSATLADMLWQNTCRLFNIPLDEPSSVKNDETAPRHQALMHP